MITYLWYILGDTFTMISHIAPSSNIIPFSYIYMWIYSPGISNVSMSRPSCASTSVVMNTESAIDIGEAVSSCFIVPRYFLPYAHARLFMLNFHFSFRKVIDTTTSALYLFVSLVASTGTKVYRRFSCVIYFVTDASPCFLKTNFTYLVHIVPWICGVCDFPFPPRPCLCSDGINRCCQF